MAGVDDDQVRIESTYRGDPYAFPGCGGLDPSTADTHWTRWFEDATVVSSAARSVATRPPR